MRVLSISVKRRGDECAVFFKIRRGVMTRDELDQAVRELLESVKGCRRVWLSGVAPTWFYGSAVIELSKVADEVATYLPYKDLFIKVFPNELAGEYVGDHTWFA